MEYKTLSVVGSRNYPPELIDWVKSVIKRFAEKFNTKVVCSGGAEGVDSWAEEAAKELDLSYQVLRPSLYRGKKGATFLRNTDIVQTGDFCLAFTTGSRGTQDSIDKCGRFSKPVIVFDAAKKIIKNTSELSK